jgi:hypothetical protein
MKGFWSIIDGEMGFGPGFGRLWGREVEKTSFFKGGKSGVWEVFLHNRLNPGPNPISQFGGDLRLNMYFLPKIMRFLGTMGWDWRKNGKKGGTF